jgi:hypothetical protein
MFNTQHRTHSLETFLLNVHATSADKSFLFFNIKNLDIQF